MILDTSLIVISVADEAKVLLTFSALNKSTFLPREVIWVCVGDIFDVPIPVEFELKPLPFPIPSRPFPAGKAKNLGASVARSKQLIFMEAGCIPAPDFLEKMDEQIRRSNGLNSAKHHYLKDEVSWNTNPKVWKKNGQPLPVSPYFTHAAGVEQGEFDPLFCKALGVSRSIFSTLGGFNATFEGVAPYGQDLALRARDNNVELALTDAEVYHPHDAKRNIDSVDFEEIIDNAWRFYQRWKYWPMQTRLREWTELGLIRWSAAQSGPIDVVRLPGPSDFEKCSKDALPFY